MILEILTYVQIIMMYVIVIYYIIDQLLKIKIVIISY